MNPEKVVVTFNWPNTNCSFDVGDVVIVNIVCAQTGQPIVCELRCVIDTLLASSTDVLVCAAGAE